MSTGRPSRQAATKATELMHEAAGRSERKKSTPAKRKGSQEVGKAPQAKAKREKTEDKHETQQNGKPAKQEATKDGVKGTDGDKMKERPPSPEEKAEKKTTPPAENITTTAVRESEEREEALPSNILEKGIIYFFYRPRVSVEEPESVEDIARSFIVLRPLPMDAALSKGPIGDDENCRLMVLPKKKLPASSSDRYTGFVEKAGVNVKTLRESFLGSEYETKTKGTQHAPPARPLAEGVYALTSTTRTSHLAYILTIPSKLDEVQTDFGLKNRGSFVMSTKNPKFPGPAAARLPKPPDFPQDVLDELRDLRWAPTQPKFLNYPNSQFLMIGEAQETLGKGGETEEKESGKEKPADEIEMLEHENEVRAYPLRGNDTVFDDLGMNLQDYPKVPTTWE